MTTHRDLKKTVRARMARTGERYTAARAQLVRPAGDPQTSCGVHPETSALVRLLAPAGVRGPGGRPVSEALVLGLGGGLGAACFVFDYEGHTPTFYVATRCQPQLAYDDHFVRAAAERLGATCEVTHATSAAAAQKKLVERVARGPVMVWVDASALPWSLRLGRFGQLGAVPHVIVVDGVSGERALARDTAGGQRELTLAELAQARARLRNGRHRLLTIERCATPPDPERAVRDAIASCVAELRGRSPVRGPMSKNFGVSGLERCAAAMRGDKGTRAFARVFPPAHAANLLVWLRHWIELAGTGGGGFRPLYADFLDEAAALLGLQPLRTLAREVRRLGQAWSALADAALPDEVPALAALRKAQDAIQAAVVRGDLAGQRAAEDELHERLAATTKAPPLEADALAAHYAALGARLAAIAGSERVVAERMAVAASLS